MKWLLAVPTLALILAGCSRHGDARVRKELAGTWVVSGGYKNGGSFENTITIAPSGSYVCQLVFHSTSGSTRTDEIEGTFEVRDGALIDTMTKASNTNSVVPTRSRARIVRIEEREMVLEWEPAPGSISPTNELVFRRLRQ